MLTRWSCLLRPVTIRRTWPATTPSARQSSIRASHSRHLPGQEADLVAFVARWQADNPKEPFASLFLGFGYDTIHLAEQAIKTAATQDEAGWAAAMTKVDWVGAQGHYEFSATDHIGGHGGFMQWQYTDRPGLQVHP